MFQFFFSLFNGGFAGASCHFNLQPLIAHLANVARHSVTTLQHRTGHRRAQVLDARNSRRSRPGFASTICPECALIDP